MRSAQIKAVVTIMIAVAAFLMVGLYFMLAAEPNSVVIPPIQSEQNYNERSDTPDRTTRNIEPTSKEQIRTPKSGDKIVDDPPADNKRGRTNQPQGVI